MKDVAQTASKDRVSRHRLACKVLLRDLLKGEGKETTISVEPIRGLPVEKDLVVDMEP